MTGHLFDPTARPSSNRLLGPDGGTVARGRTVRATSVRAARLDDDGHLDMATATDIGPCDVSTLDRGPFDDTPVRLADDVTVSIDFDPTDCPRALLAMLGVPALLGPDGRPIA